MFARQTFRAAQPLKTQYRRYATEKAGGSSLTGILGTVAAIGVVGAGGNYLYQGRNASQLKEVAKDAETKAKDVIGQGKAKMEEAGPKKYALTGGDQGFISIVLENVEIINHNTKKFRFKLPEEDQTSGLHVTSALLAKYKGPEDAKAVLRPYTPVNAETDKGYLDLIVKKYPNGPMSTHFHDMQPGQSIEIKGPLPKYPWTENKHDHIALIAGGTGITPMYQLARAIFANPNEKTKVTLIFGNITEEDILLKKEFEELENTYPQRFRAFYVLNKPPKEWSGGKGVISKELLKTVLPEPKSENIKIFVCGPPGLYKAVSGAKISPSNQGELDGSLLEQLGYSKDQVYKF